MNIWEFIKSKLKENKNVVLMLVIDNQGSSPGRKGFKMAVADDGKMIGSVGGGVMEYNMVELAKKQFTQPNGIFLKRQIHSSDNHPDSSGMICSGSQVIVFYPLDRVYLSVVESIVKADSGSLEFNESGIIFKQDGKLEQEFITNIVDDHKWLFAEQLGLKNKLFIFGAGHVSVALSKLFKQLGFHITIFDNRDEDLTTFKNNSFADSKQIIRYEEVVNYIPEGENIYVVIMTFAHSSDRKVLKDLIDKKVKYLGMMASQKKAKSIYEQLEKEGVSAEQLSRVDSPIGIQINSQTPDEIAVSIAAKIISVKNS